jgi:hypothetical protein
MHKERLLKLANFLETVEPERFDLSTWSDSNFTPEKCDTAACACGWATVIFKDEGFTLYNSMPMYNDDKNRRSYISWKAVQAFFDITNDGAEYLFCNSSYEDDGTSPLEVSERIRRFTNGKD